MKSNTHGLPELPVWLGVCLIALVMSGACLLDGPPEIEAAQAVAIYTQDAIQSAASNAQIVAAVRP